MADTGLNADQLLSEELVDKDENEGLQGKNPDDESKLQADTGPNSYQLPSEEAADKEENEGLQEAIADDGAKLQADTDTNADQLSSKEVLPFAPAAPKAAQSAPAPRAGRAAMHSRGAVVHLGRALDRIPGAESLVPRAIAVVAPQLLASLCAACIAMAPDAALANARDAVDRVVDGDTVVLWDLGRVRMIGMNTPETVAPAQRKGAPPQCYGPEASARTKQLLPPGTPVRVEFDVEPEDKFGRSLAYLYLEDGTFINGRLVREGFARAKQYKPNTRYADKLSQLQKEAKAEGLGLWSACEDAKSSSGKGFDPRRASASKQPARPPRTTAERQQSLRAAQQELTNPGDVKNCADFGTYREAKAYYDLYFPRFGDVAKLDGDGDGKPCEGLLKKEMQKSGRG